MLLLDFINLEITPSNLLDLYSHYGIIHTVDGQNRGSDDVCITREDLNHRFCLTDEAYKGLEDWPQDSFLSPKEGADLLRSALKKSQTRYEKFIEGCMARDLDLKFLNDALNDISPDLRFFPNQENIFKPTLQYSKQILVTLEDHIDLSILTVFLKGDGEFLQKIKKCEQCGGYFPYKRESAKFCSKECKRDFHNKRSPSRCKI
jgi:hypothetical protein